MSNLSKSWNDKESRENREQIISVRVQMLAAAMNRKCSDEMVEIFKRHLNRFPINVLNKAFTRAESEMERFPAVRQVASMCGEAMPSEGWRYNFQPGVDNNGVKCLIDPDPCCDVCRKQWSEHPTPTCKAVVSEREAQFMYRPQDCFEGRGFLHMLETMSKEKREERKRSSVTVEPVSAAVMEENDAAYDNWLSETKMRESAENKQGLPAVPRTKQEKEALYWAMPTNERKRLRRKLENIRKPASA